MFKPSLTPTLKDCVAPATLATVISGGPLGFFGRQRRQLSGTWTERCHSCCASEMGLPLASSAAAAAVTSGMQPSVTWIAGVPGDKGREKRGLSARRRDK